MIDREGLAPVPDLSGLQASGTTRRTGSCRFDITAGAIGRSTSAKRDDLRFDLTRSSEEQLSDCPSAFLFNCFNPKLQRQVFS